MLFIAYIAFTYIFILHNNNVVAYDKISCFSCKWFISNKHGNYNYGQCKMSKHILNLKENKENVETDKNTKVIYDFAEHCRKNENICGKNGFLYEYIGNKYEYENNNLNILQ